MPDKRHYGYGPTIHECPSCGDKLCLFCPRWFVAAVIVAEMIGVTGFNFGFIAPVAESWTQFVWMPVVVLEWCFGWWMGSRLNDFWQQVWHWRHPTRCRQDRGTLAPAPGAA